MNTAKVIDILMDRLNRTATSFRGTILNELSFIQSEEMERAAELPWFIITESTETLLQVDERRVKLPTDFLREVEESPLYVATEDGEHIEVVKGEYEDLEEYYGVLATGSPRHFALRGDYVVLFPIPDFAYRIVFPDGYYAKQPLPQDNTSSENQWFKHASDVLMNKAGLNIASMKLKDPELVAIFGPLANTAADRLNRAIIAHHEVNRDRVMNPK